MMPRDIQLTLYSASELQPKARARARAWYRETAFFDEWYDGVFEDFQAICAILGVKLKAEVRRKTTLRIQDRPRIFFRLSHCQGDGASFECNYRYRRGALRELKTYAPQDSTLHAIAQALQDIQRRNFYQLVATTTVSGLYVHEHAMCAEISRESDSNLAPTEDAGEIIITTLRRLAKWLYEQLSHEYDHLNSDEVVDEALAANDYTFTHSGTRFG